jgi:hypothetical protein
MHGWLAESVAGVSPATIEDKSFANRKPALPDPTI